MFIIQSGKGLGTTSKITRESGIKTRTSTAHDLNPQKSRALFATPSSSLEDLESTKGKKFCKMTTSSSSYEDNLPLSQSGNGSH